MAERSRLDVTFLLQEVRREFGTSRPARGKLATFIAGFGVGDSIALAALILAGWAYLNPRDPEKSPRCKQKWALANRICAGKFVHTEYDEANCRLIMICEHGHKTVKRIALR